MVGYQDHPAKLDVSEVVILLLICCAESFYSRGSSYVVRLSSSNLAILRPGIPSHASEWLGYEGSVTLKLLTGTKLT